MVKAGSYSVIEETPHIPEEVVIEEILPRLPVKSLLKFRCVAKSWCSLIESKKFMKTHLESSIKTSRFAHHPISFYTIEPYQVCPLSLFDKPFTDRKTFTADLGIDSDLTIELVGCCNGLVCLLIDEKRFILWNPATKKFNNLPVFPNKKEYSYIQLYGFGFDELNDDYKVFALVWDHNAAGGCYSTVYSLRSNSWNVIEETPESISSGAGMYVNGNLHWYKCSYYAREIVSFDLNSYVYGVVQLPIDTAESTIMMLGVNGGCLSAHYYFGPYPNMGFDVWILKEYGVKESWDKVATVPYFNLPIRLLKPAPIAIDPNGDIFLMYGSDVMIYDTKSDEVRHPNVISHDLFRDMGIYIESLALVAPEAEQER